MCHSTLSKEEYFNGLSFQNHVTKAYPFVLCCAPSIWSPIPKHTSSFPMEWEPEMRSRFSLPRATFLGVYGKNHPVIFVNERSATKGMYPTYKTGLGEMGTIICYDLDFTDTARKVARNGATLIAVPSGDWPGIADKHYAHVVFRAVENRVAMIKADRSYDSAIIDPYGRIVRSVVSREGSQSTLVADVTVIQANPPQRYLGDWIGWLSLAGMVFFAILNPYTSLQRGRNF